MNINNYLQNLATDILKFQQNGISKVRFAKYIYFVHKDLIRKSLVKTDNLEFIRMPLGPVPVGFMDLGNYENIAKSKKINTLIYDSEIYQLSGSFEFTTGFIDYIKLIVAELDRYSTSSLVEISHREPSWKGHVNGDQYFITRADLDEKFPKRVKHTNPELENESLQASLVKGMIEDIVEESTSLEYPKK